MSRIDGYGYYQQSLVNSKANPEEIAGAKDGKRDPRIPQWNPDEDAAVYEKAEQQKPVTYGKPVVGAKKSEQPDVYANLSEAAKSLLEELKEKYGRDTDFIIGNFATDEEAQELMAQGTKQYTVLIDPELLEKMASDDSVKESTLKEIEDAKGQMDSIMEELGDDADKVEGIGISVGADGTISYFAKLKEDSDKRSQQIQDDLKARREDAKAERKEKEKERLEEHRKKIQDDKALENNKSSVAKEDEEKKSNIVTASSIEELLAMIRG